MEIKPRLFYQVVKIQGRPRPLTTDCTTEKFQSEKDTLVHSSRELKLIEDFFTFYGHNFLYFMLIFLLFSFITI